MRGKGEGSIYKRKSDGRWCASVELPSHDGNRRRKVLTAKTKNELLELRKKTLADLERSGDIPTASQTLESWLTYWLEKVAPRRIRPNTLVDYRSKMINNVIPVIGKVRLDKLTQTSIRRVHEAMHERGLSSTYMLNTHRVLATALNDAMRDGRLSRNVAKLVDAPKLGKTKSEPLDIDEAIDVYMRALRALQAEPYDPTAVVYACYILTANRRGELLGLEWDRVRFSDEHPHIDLSWQLQVINDITTAPPDFEYHHIHGKLYKVRPKTKAGWRIIPLFEPLASLLQEHRARMGNPVDGFVFLNTKGRPLYPDRVTGAWSAWRAIVTDKKTVVHDLRHTTVDFLLEAGVPEDVIQEIVGHSTWAMTQRYKRRGNHVRLALGMQHFSEFITRSVEDASPGSAA